MSTPVLSKRQQRHSLSAKKTPAKGLRNVLAQPHENFWPLVPKCSELEDLFKNLAPVAKRPYVRRKRLKKDEAKMDEQESKRPQSILLGINAVTRSLEKNSICCVLLDSNIDPPFMVKHILTMARNKKVPILLIPCLKAITSSSIGIPSAAFGLKNTVKETEGHQFYPLYEHIENTFNQLPLPKDSLSLFNKIEPDETLESVENETNEKKEESKASAPTKFTLSTDVYKYRSSRTERVFVPPTGEKSSSVEKMECDSVSMEENGADKTVATPEQDLPQTGTDDFISIGHYDWDTEEASGKDKSSLKPKGISGNGDSVRYLSLKVKRIQGNSKRAKATKMARPKKK